jgi:hypothetical protein
VIDESLKSNDRSTFKNESDFGHGDKHHWKYKGVSKFDGVEPTSKLEELLLNYTMDDKHQLLAKQLSSHLNGNNTDSSLRNNKKNQRINRNREFN